MSGSEVPMRAVVRYENVPRDAFKGFPDELTGTAAFRANELVNFLTEVAAVNVLESLGIDRESIVAVTEQLMAESDPLACRQLVDSFAGPAGVAPERLEVFEWLFEWLSDRERSIDPGGGLVDEPLETLPGLVEAYERVTGEDATLKPSADMIGLATRGYVAFLRAEAEGDKLLFQPGTLELWDAYFANSHRVTRELNLLGCLAFERALAGRDGLDVLELGGGLGGAAEMLLGRLGGRIGRYHFTDVVPGFLRRGADRLEEQFSEVSLSTGMVDINRPFGDQCLEKESFDAIYAVNVLHLAVELVDALERLRELLRPRGRLVLVEGVRAALHRPIAAEFVFQLLPQFRAVKVDPETRCRAGFLDDRHWRKSISVAGFASVESVPEMSEAVEAYPNHYMAAFIAGT